MRTLTPDLSVTICATDGTVEHIRTLRPHMAPSVGDNGVEHARNILSEEFDFEFAWSEALQGTSSGSIGAIHGYPFVISLTPLFGLRMHRRRIVSRIVVTTRPILKSECTWYRDHGVDLCCGRSCASNSGHDITNTYLHNVQGRCVYERQTWLKHPPAAGMRLGELEERNPDLGSGLTDSFEEAMNGNLTCHWGILDGKPYHNDWIPYYADEGDERPLMVASSVTMVPPELLDFLNHHDIPY